MLYLIQQFPLNARIIYEDAFLVVENNRRINFIAYLIKDVKEAFVWQMKSSAEEKEVFMSYLEASSKVFFCFTESCVLRTSELKLIASSLTDFYYEEQLYTKMIGQCFRFLTVAMQDRDIMPYVYCDDKGQG